MGEGTLGGGGVTPYILELIGGHQTGARTPLAWVADEGSSPRLAHPLNAQGQGFRV